MLYFYINLSAGMTLKAIEMWMKFDYIFMMSTDDKEITLRVKHYLRFETWRTSDYKRTLERLLWSVI